ncbi:hypothetical protein KFK09_000625 [Dendrobium nobile]|uniref:Uncharacterized protein n=1 Tax=Dendrobium nobile TaxID=94219 RepID=A0A8T3C928_DENNO|nr:hypothetical protein KFK09_000625 [Dendrobium nobile]
MNLLEEQRNFKICPSALTIWNLHSPLCFSLKKCANLYVNCPPSLEKIKSIFRDLNQLL